MRLALYQPDIAQNTGTLLRLGACLDLEIDIIEPCGFMFNAKYRRHDSWADFLAYRDAHRQEYGRLVLMTTKASIPFTDFKFLQNDIILMGRESAGVPQSVHDMVDAELLIPMNKNARSVNMAISAAMAVTEGLRQTDGFPKL